MENEWIVKSTGEIAVDKAYNEVQSQRAVAKFKINNPTIECTRHSCTILDPSALTITLKLTHA